MAEKSNQVKPWLKHYVNGVPEEIKFEDVFLIDFLDRWAKLRADDDALIFQGYRMSFKELKDKVDRLASCLADFGIRKGDRVAILMPKSDPLRYQLLCHPQGRRNCRHE